MDKVQVILYAAASFLAIKSLISLMTDHRQNYKRKLAQELMSAKQSTAATSATEGKSEPQAKQAG